jgi:glycosyltransferase involved in cell wall biosynthesis
MRIFLSSGHVYPGWLNGVSSHRVHDNLARGLAALGHDVRYRPEGWGQARPPEGIRPVSDVEGDEDILHVNHLPLTQKPATALPWVVSVHADVKYNGLTPDYAIPNWIYVSRTLAGLYGSDRFVYNGIDPSDFIYSEAKENYFLFAVAGAVKRAQMKGVEIAFRIARLTGVELRVAGGSNNLAEMLEFERYCRDHGAVCVGLVHGRRKAELFAGARALLFPTQMNEAFGVTVAEALMSGTPVIASDKGAMGELLNPSVGFVCTNESSYLDAIARLNRIAPPDCRQLAMERFHYVEMARSYVREYEREIARTSRDAAPSPVTRPLIGESVPSAQ